jgi:cytoskeletal protein CcmA (bactofilin family)
MKKSSKPSNTIDTLIGVTTTIKGDINFSGGLRIDGKVNGNIAAETDGTSTLVLSEHAMVKGDVTVPHMILNGKIKGNVICAEKIELQPKAEIIGDLHYKVIEMAEGASINGNLVRDAASADSQAKSAVTKLKSVVSGQDDGKS